MGKKGRRALENQSGNGVFPPLTEKDGWTIFRKWKDFFFSLETTSIILVRKR